MVFHGLTPAEMGKVASWAWPATSSWGGTPKQPDGPKRPKPKKQSGAKIKHVATAKILRRAAGQSLPKNPKQVHAQSGKQIGPAALGEFRKPLSGITFLTVHPDSPCQHGEARRGPCRS